MINNNKQSKTKESLFRSRSLYALIIAILLLLSWSVPHIHYFWDRIDEYTYKGLHAFFLQTESLQRFWAIMNSRIGDNTSHALFFLLFIRYIFSDNGIYIKKRLKQVAFILTAVVISIITSKSVQSFIAERVSIKRNSPSLVYGHTVLLSEAYPELKNIKDSSRRCFPGDHAMTLFLLIGFIFHYIKKPKLCLIAVFASIIFILPRLISGGHWITDAIMGSFPIAVFFYVIWMFVLRKIPLFVSKLYRNTELKSKKIA